MPQSSHLVDSMPILSYSFILSSLKCQWFITIKIVNIAESLLCTRNYSITICILSHLILAAILECRSCCPHFTGEKTEVQTNISKEVVEPRVSAFNHFALRVLSSG